MIVNYLIPLAVVLLMVIVGTGLQPRQFALVLRSPIPMLGGTLTQILLLPAGALLIVLILKPPLELAAGLLLISACPGAALSNFYSYFGRLNVALSVSMTAVSSTLGFIVLPITLSVVFPVVLPVQELEIPVKELIFRLFLLLLLPIAAGMLIRYYFSKAVEQYEKAMRMAGLLLVVLLLALIFHNQWDGAKSLFYDAAILAAFFTVYALVAGWLVAFALRQDTVDRYVFSVEFAVRNVGAAAVVAATTLGRPEFVIFGALFIVFQFPLIMLLLFGRKRLGLETTQMS